MGNCHQYIGYHLECKRWCIHIQINFWRRWNRIYKTFTVEENDNLIWPIGIFTTIHNTHEDYTTRTVDKWVRLKWWPSRTPCCQRWNLVWRNKRIIIDSVFNIFKEKRSRKRKTHSHISDESSEAYGAVTYQQCVCQSGGVTSCLVMPKAIAASLKLISILQPVLLSAILGFKLGENVTGA